MSKFRVIFDMDLNHIVPEMEEGSDEQEMVMELVRATLLTNARANIRNDLRKIQNDHNLDFDVKAMRMAGFLKKMMLTLQAEANLTVERLENDVVIKTRLPFENKFAEAA